MNHYPYHLWKFGQKSSKKKSIHDILKNKKIGYFLNGHLHPSKPYYLHHGNLLEIVGCDLKEHQKFSLAIIDNGRLSYHPISLIETRENSTFSFISNPLPDEILTNHQIFNEMNTYIRVIVYSNKEPSIRSSVYLDDFDNHTLECRKIDDEFGNLRFWLCETELNVKKYGKYKLYLSGDVDKSLEFTVSDSIPGFKEDVYVPVNSFIVQYEVYLALIWLFLLIVTFPFFVLPEETKQKFDMWIEGESPDSMWIYSIFFGFLAVKGRIERLPNLIRFSLFVAVLWPLCLPIIFMTIDHHIGFVWT